MRIYVAGPESSGTKLVAQLLKESGADVVHRSYPYGGDRPDNPSWPDGNDMHDCDAVVCCVREPYATACSQTEVGHTPNHSTALVHMHYALCKIYNQASARNKPVYHITYESLVLNNNSIGALAEMLKLDPGKIVTVVQDANIKYYNGVEFRDQRPLEER